MSVADIMDPTANPSTYSQTFRVPNTANNNLFFKSAFNINTVTFDATKKIESYIQDSNVTISVGSIRLTNIITNNKDKNVEYEVTFFGEVSALASKIGGGFLNSLDLSQYNHEKNYVNIVNSWNLNLFGGDVIYPLIEWGYDYLNGVPVQNTLALHNGTLAPNGFTSNGKPLSISQFKPVIRAKVLIDAIFKDSGFTYDSQFINVNNSDFMNQYVITEQIDSATATHESNIQLDVRNNSIQNVQPNTEVQLLFTNEIVDSLSSFDTITNYFTVPSTLPAFTFYQFNLKGLVFSDVFGPIVMTNVTVKAIDVLTSTTLATYTIAPLVTNININANLVLPSTVIAGQQIKFTIEINTTNSLAGIMLGILTQITGSGGLVILNNFLPNNVKNIDFLKGFIERYNLVLEPSKTIDKHFTITPWVDWVEQGTQRDWTAYVDGNVDIQSKPLFESQTRSNTWRDDEDSDYVNYNFQTATKTTYGQLDLDSQIEILVGNNLVESLFAPTPLLPIGNASSIGTPNQKLAAQFLIPHIAKDTTTERTPVAPKLRLVYYNGMRNAPLEWHIKNDSNTTIHWNQYPLVSQYSVLDNLGTSFNDMAWRNAAPLWDITPSVPNPEARTTRDLWNNYWRKWYDFTYDPFGRILEMNIVLDYKKVWDLKFNDKIFIKDSWFMVNKITDYEVGKPTSCKVELIRVGQSISIVPRPIIEGQFMCYFPNVEDPCEVYCCYENGNATIKYFELNGQLFLDANGNFPAPSGFYSYGSSNTFSVINGIITTYYNTSGCVCVEPVQYKYDACFGQNVSDASCCILPSQPFYGFSNTLWSCPHAWSDIAMTTPVPDGWYYNSSEPFVAQFINGFNVQVAFVVHC